MHNFLRHLASLWQIATFVLKETSHVKRVYFRFVTNVFLGKRLSSHQNNVLILVAPIPSRGWWQWRDLNAATSDNKGRTNLTLYWWYHQDHNSFPLHCDVESLIFTSYLHVFLITKPVLAELALYGFKWTMTGTLQDITFPFSSAFVDVSIGIRVSWWRFGLRTDQLHCLQHVNNGQHLSTSQISTKSRAVPI